jgi:hypothetical protein
MAPPLNQDFSGTGLAVGESSNQKSADSRSAARSFKAYGKTISRLKIPVKGKLRSGGCAPSVRLYNRAITIASA